MANRWVEFIKEWANKNNTTYGCAMGNPQLKLDYREKYPPKEETFEITPVKKQKKKKQKAPEIALEPMEQVFQSTEPKSKNIIINKPAPAPETFEIEPTKKKKPKKAPAPAPAPAKVISPPPKKDKSHLASIPASKLKPFERVDHFHLKYGDYFQGFKDKLGNYIVFYLTPLDTRGIERPDGTFISFAKDQDELTKQEKKLYEPYFAFINSVYELIFAKKISDHSGAVKVLEYLNNKMS